MRTLLLACIYALAYPLHAQERGTPAGEWRYWGADAWSTRYSPVDQIDATNFEELEVAWTWWGDNFGPSVDYILRAAPINARGMLFAVAGRRPPAVAIVRPRARRSGRSASRTRRAGTGARGRATARAWRTRRSTDAA